MGNDGRGKTKDIRMSRQLPIEDQVSENNFHPVAISLHNRFFVSGIADKKDPFRPCLPVEILSNPIGPHVPIEDIDICIRIPALYFQCAQYRMGAADL